MARSLGNGLREKRPLQIQTPMNPGNQLRIGTEDRNRQKLNRNKMAYLKRISLGATRPVFWNNSAWRDWVGIVASIGCAIHCAAMPFVIAYLPALGLSFLADEGFHQWMALACFLIAIVAFIPGLKKHGSWIPISIATVGLGLITFAAMGWAGDCCPSCEEKKSGAVAATESGCEECDDCASSQAAGNQLALSSTTAAPEAGCEQCEDCASSDAFKNDLAVSAPDCEHCEDCATSEATLSGQSLAQGSGIGIDAEEEAALLLLLAPWITPIGGLLLVSAHLCNRRFGCLCGCCSNDAQPINMGTDNGSLNIKEPGDGSNATC